MMQTTPARHKILIAVPKDHWQEVLCQLLEQRGFSVLIASSLDEALSAIQSEDPCAIVTISDWAMARDDADGLMNVVKAKIPTVSLITQTTWQKAHYRWFEELCYPPLHEYCTLPADIEEISTRLKSVLDAAAKSIPQR